MAWRRGSVWLRLRRAVATLKEALIFQNSAFYPPATSLECFQRRFPTDSRQGVSRNTFPVIPDFSVVSFSPRGVKRWWCGLYYVTAEDYSGRDGRGRIRLDFGAHRFQIGTAWRRFRNGTRHRFLARPSDGRSPGPPAPGHATVSDSRSRRARAGAKLRSRRKISGHAIQNRSHANAPPRPGAR